MPAKIVFLIPDGMGDYPILELDNKTPLQAAKTPNMDSLAQKSTLGQCQTIPESMPPGSDIANMALLGYDPLKFHTGRGPIEASAQGLELDPEDLVFRLNLCTVSEFSPDGIMQDYCAGHIQTDQAKDLLQKISPKTQNQKFEIVPGFQYRHLLVQKNGLNSQEAGLEINPPHDILNQSIAKDIKEYSSSPSLSKIVFQAAEILSSPENQTKANAIWPWGQGKPITMPGFMNTFACQGAIISAVDLVKGLGRAAGMEVLEVQGATGLLDTNYQGKVEAAQKYLEQGDFVYLHLEAPDECGHAGSYAEKIQAIENFDSKILGPLMQTIEDMQAVCMIACDHYTPVSVRTHTREPVPFLVYNPARPEKGPLCFSEKEAGKTGLFLEKGQDLLPWILNQV